MKIFIKHFSTLLFLFIFQFNSFGQDFTFPTHTLKGDVVQLFETQKDVYLRKEIWEFKKEEFRYGSIYSFDQNGHYQSVKSYYDPTILLNKVEFSTTPNGNLQAGNVFGFRNKLVSTYSFTVGSNGKIETIQIIVPDTKKAYKSFEYKYQNGKLNQTIIKYAGRDTSEVINEIENQKLIKATKTNKKGELELVLKYHYNQNGFKEKVEFFDPDQKLINLKTYIYQYDKKGNWIKRLETVTKTDHRQITIRKIVYKEDLSPKKMSKKDLTGFWLGWSEDYSIEFKNNKVNITDRVKKSDKESEFTFNPTSGQLVTGIGKYSQRSNHQVEFDGNTLILKKRNDDDEFYHKLKAEDLPSHQRRDFIYRSTPKPETETFREAEKYGLKGAKGKVLFSAKYDDLLALTRQAVMVKKNEKWGLVNYQGKQLTEFKYDKLTLRKLGYIRFKIDGKAGLLDPKGKEVLPAIYDNIGVSPTGYFQVVKANKNGIISLDNKTILPIEYQNIDKISFNRTSAQSSNSFAKYWLDRNFKMIKEFIEYQAIRPIDVNCWKVRTNRNWGLIDSLGEEIIPTQYAEITRGASQLLIAKFDNRFGLINTSGEVIAPFKYDRIVTAYQGDYHQEIDLHLLANQAAAIYILGDEFGYLDGLGNEIKPTPTKSNGGRFSKKITEKLFELTYTYKWNKNGSLLVHSDKNANASLKIYTIPYQGSLEDWSPQNAMEHNLKERTIDGKKAFLTTETVDKIFKQKIYIPLKNNKLIQLNFNCKTYQYPRVAQDLFDLIHSIKIME